MVPGGSTDNPRVSGFRKARRGPGPSAPCLLQYSPL
jgi:hypothetical protein